MENKKKYDEDSNEYIRASYIAHKFAEDYTFTSLCDVMPKVAYHILDMVEQVYITAYNKGVNDTLGVVDIDYPNFITKENDNV